MGGLVVVVYAVITSSQSEITDAPFLSYFFIFVLNVLFELFVLCTLVRQSISVAQKMA